MLQTPQYYYQKLNKKQIEIIITDYQSAKA
jgi:hypothetical protein